MRYKLGLDFGGTKIEGAILDEHLQVVDRMRVDTGAHLGYHHILSQMKTLIDQLETKNSITFSKVGIATPGTLDPITNTMKNCNATAVNGKAMKVDLETLLKKEVLLSNDANCFAVAETLLGIVPDIMPEAKVVFGVIMGTGVGGGVVVNGSVVGGRQGIGGEWGHNFLDEIGGECYCGKKGCVESVFSGPSLERYYANLAGTEKKMKEIVTAYRNNDDEHATATMTHLFKNFGKAISVIINILDPDVIVIGGGLGNIDEVYSHGVACIQEHVFNHRLDTVFVKPKLGDSAGVFGAALL
jgi:fructokinase